MPGLKANTAEPEETHLAHWAVELTLMYLLAMLSFVWEQGQKIRGARQGAVRIF